MSEANRAVSGAGYDGGGTSNATESGGAWIFRRRSSNVVADVTDVATINSNATKTLSVMRIMFGVVFLFDGILKWTLFANGQMQSVIDGFGYTFLSNNWVTVGVLVGLGETIGGICLMLGIFQRPAAVWSAAIMFAIWALGGFGGYNMPGFTDPGGDLMLALVFVVLIFAPYAYGLASRFRLRDRFAGASTRDKVMRFVVT